MEKKKEKKNGCWPTLLVHQKNLILKIMYSRYDEKPYFFISGTTSRDFSVPFHFIRTIFTIRTVS